MSIRRRLVGVLAVFAVLGFYETASAQGPGGRGGPQPRGMSMSGGGQMQGGCAGRTSPGTTTSTLSASRQYAPAQSQYSQLVAQQQMQAWYANYYAEQTAYKVYLDNLLRRDAERRAARQLQTGN